VDPEAYDQARARYLDGEGSVEDLRRLAEAADADELPEDFPAERVLGDVWAHWEDARTDRDLALLFLRSLGLTRGDGESGPPPWYIAHGRVAGMGGGAYDAGSGLPLSARRCRDDAAMTGVLAGPFRRGIGALPSPDGPTIRGETDAFFVDRRRVSVGQYYRYLEAVGRHPPADLGARDPSGPMTGLAWEEAAAYATWAGGRLPTSDEFDKAMRGWDGDLYPWGSAEGEEGPSPFGLVETRDDQWEWCQDWYHPDAYQLGIQKGDFSVPYAPPAPAEGEDRASEEEEEYGRVVRRGSPVDDAGKPTPVARRGHRAPDRGYPDVSFRVVVPLPTLVARGAPRLAPPPALSSDDCEPASLGTWALRVVLLLGCLLAASVAWRNYLS
jgi:formylglycine-generating enzyme required for sulfatase activity